MGTSSADELIADELYWTYHSTTSPVFKGWDKTNPTFTIMFQPSECRSPIEGLCDTFGAYVMFSRPDMPIQRLVSYDYNVRSAGLLCVDLPDSASTLWRWRMFCASHSRR